MLTDCLLDWLIANQYDVFQYGPVTQKEKIKLEKLAKKVIAFQVYQFYISYRCYLRCRRNRAYLFIYLSWGLHRCRWQQCRAVLSSSWRAGTGFGSWGLAVGSPPFNLEFGWSRWRMFLVGASSYLKKFWFLVLIQLLAVKFGTYFYFWLLIALNNCFKANDEVFLNSVLQYYSWSWEPEPDLRTRPFSSSHLINTVVRQIRYICWIANNYYLFRPVFST